MLLLIPQRYEFSSKSQHYQGYYDSQFGCCWYHKGTNFQANHNSVILWLRAYLVVVDTTKVRIFKQITTISVLIWRLKGCCWYHKGTNFQANHNKASTLIEFWLVVVDTTKVRIFKQITTNRYSARWYIRCCWYHKGTNFQANHNSLFYVSILVQVVVDTTKVRIFKQITTWRQLYNSM